MQECVLAENIYRCCVKACVSLPRRPLAKYPTWNSLRMIPNSSNISATTYKTSVYASTLEPPLFRKLYLSFLDALLLQISAILWVVDGSDELAASALLSVRSLLSVSRVATTRISECMYPSVLLLNMPSSLVLLHVTLPRTVGMESFAPRGPWAMSADMMLL